MLKFLRSFLIGAGVLLLTACGGGGIVDNNDTNDSNNTPTTQDGGDIVDNNDTPIVDTVPPIFTSPSTTSINENRQSAMTLVATDTSHVIYGISGIDADSFNVDENTGVVTFKIAPDYESGKTSYTFTATATDEAGNTATQNVTITILDVDETVPDTTPPVITLLGTNPASVTQGQTYADAGATAVDEIDGDITPSMTGEVNVNSVGSYTITYSATDTAGNTATATRTVTVNAIPNVAPTAVASATPTTATEGSVISFNASGSSDSDGSIASYEWKEGSVVLSIAQSFTKNNFTVGTHTITLTVTDDDGVTDSTTVMVTVNAVPNVAPTAVATVSPATATEGSVISFNGTGSSDSDGSIASYEWKEGSVVLSIAQSFTKNNFTVGTHTITLTVTDDDGVTDSTTVMVTVNAVPNVAPTAVATVSPATATEGSVISFNGTGSSDSDGSIASYEWKEGSVVLSTAESFTKSDFTVGTHTITLTVTDDDDATAADTVVVTIESNVATQVLLKKTGQTTSFYTGDDGYYQKGVTPSYSRANEVVTDHITGLQWQDNEVVEKKWTDSTGETAAAYCSNLSLDGGGWRLPTIKELQSIVVEKYVENGSLEVGIDTSVFVNYATNTYNYYWSSTTYLPLPDYALAMQLYGANMGFQSKFTRHYVRCVR